MSQRQAPSIWWWAFGYFAAYAPYAAFTKAATDVGIDGNRVDGNIILPVTVIATVVTAVLFLVYVGYLLLRAMVDEPERRARIAAVVGIVGAANIPIVHFSVKWWRALHQPSTILGPEPSPIAGPIAAALFVNWVAFTLLFLYLLLRRVELARLEDAWVPETRR